MINNNKKYLGVALATLTAATLVAAPQAMAKAKVAPAVVASKTDVLEAQVRVMQDEIASLRAQVNSARPAAATSSADSQRIQELDAWVASVKADGHKAHGAKSKDNMLYFRGGYVQNDRAMLATTNSFGGSSLPLGGVLPGATGGSSSGWNVGAGVDFHLNEGLFGLLDKTDLLGELDINYVDVGRYTGSVTQATAGIAAPATVSQSMMRLSASPKVKFLKGSALRPWIIPVGLTLNFISPPTQVNTISYLKPGMNFATGFDYNVWKSLYIGADVRYFLATSQLDGTNVNGLTAGGQVGFGF